MKKLTEERRVFRKELAVLFSKLEYQYAAVRAKELLRISKRLFFNEPATYFYGFIVDSLLLAKCYLRQDKLQLA